MRILLSPAKKMNVVDDSLEAAGLPVFLEETGRLLDWMRGLTFEEIRGLWGCNEKLAKMNFERLVHMDLRRNLTPALLAFEGIAYQYMAPTVFERGQYAYVQEHLRILSGFYGILKPMDGVVPYRLEMQAKGAPDGAGNLYEFWGRKLYSEVMDGERLLINLASKEYFKVVEKYLTPEDTCITCVFGELEGEKVVQKGVYAKMARGSMVRFLAENGIQRAEEMKGFSSLGYGFSEALSSEREYVFLKRQG